VSRLKHGRSGSDFAAPKARLLRSAVTSRFQSAQEAGRRSRVEKRHSDSRQALVARLEARIQALSEEEAARVLARWPEVVARIDHLAETEPEPGGLDTGRRPSLDDARRRAREVIPAILSGPDMLSSAQVGEILGISVQAVNERRRRGKLFALTTTGWSYRYPDWQFAYHEAVPGLDRALALFKKRGFSDWTVHRLMTLPQATLDGRTGLECVREADFRALDAMLEGMAWGDFG